jgi:phosphoglucosamine mutase
VDGFHQLERAIGRDIGTVSTSFDLLSGVKDALRATIPGHTTKPLDGLKLVVDCANGAAYHIAPELLRDLGANVEVLHDAPDGMNINLQCGSTHPQTMAARTAEAGADAGLAFDGDADRVIMANHRGQVVDGDHMMAVLAIDLKSRGYLNGSRVVATIMSNAGLERLLADHSIELVRTDVGDRYVAQAMDEYGASLGGEQSGHILLPAVTPTGDGLATALQVLSVMTRTRKSLADLTGDLKVYPQLLRNVRVASSAGWNQDPHITAAIDEERSRFPNPQWLSVRPSGTEPLLRVMAQAEEQELVDTAVTHICEVIQQRLGSSVQ